MEAVGNRFLPAMLAAFALARSQVAIESHARDLPRTSRAPTCGSIVLGSGSRERHGSARPPGHRLKQENFRVFDDGVERAITSFAMEDEPVAIGLIFDRSGSLDGIRRNEAETTRLFLNTSNPEDEYFLVAFASRPELAVPLTSGNGEVRYRVLTTKWGRSTALYDGVVLGLNELKKSKLRRKALLVVSDGGENNSRYSRVEVKRIIEESDALIYAIGFESNQANFPLLKWMAEMSGGLAISARAEGLPDIAAKVALELRNLYVFGFSAADIRHDGKVHSLRVQLVRLRTACLALKASWRRSYHAAENLTPHLRYARSPILSSSITRSPSLPMKNAGANRRPQTNSSCR